MIANKTFTMQAVNSAIYESRYLYIRAKIISNLK